VLSWPEAIESGKAVPAAPVPPKPDDYCTIMYTSGTTGEGAGWGGLVGVGKALGWAVGGAGAAEAR
jgi:hypothetical protein